MKRYQVGESVFAKANGFQPFPAVVENVLLNESNCSVFYYVRFLGASEVVPLGEENLLPIKENRKKFKLTYTEKELRKEAKLRVDALLGADDDIPDVLMNFVTVDSDFEEVSEDTVKRLGLHSIMLTPSRIHEFENIISAKSWKPDEGSDMDIDFVDVEELLPENQSLCDSLKSMLSFQCPVCLKSFNSSIALKRHKRRSLVCKSQAIAHVPPKQNGTNPADLEKQNQEYPNKTNQVNRSASGYYPCKLCFRKFRSKGGVQSHMATHRSHMGAKRNIVIRSPPKKVSSTDCSEDDDHTDEEERVTKHNANEQKRRAELAEKFLLLAQSVSSPIATSKVSILSVAKEKIAELENELEDKEVEIARLKDRNVRLTAHYLALSSRIS